MATKYWHLNMTDLSQWSSIGKTLTFNLDVSVTAILIANNRNQLNLMQAKKHNNKHGDASQNSSVELKRVSGSRNCSSLEESGKKACSLVSALLPKDICFILLFPEYRKGKEGVS